MVRKGRLVSGDVLTAPARPSLNPSALSVGDAARILSAAGGQRIDEEMIQADIDAGAPTNIDGTLNLVHYGAWLVKERAGGED